MPPPDSNKPPLTAAQREVLKQWIQQGAKYERHWAFEPPKRSSPPDVTGVAHPIERFIQQRLADQELAPSLAADPTTLIRRVSLDLIGLPPTLAQIDDFVKAAEKDSEGAYRELVDRLRRSPHYGERWGRWWLDQALTLMNDSGFFEFAAALEKIVEQDGLATAFRRCTARPPRADELAVLEKLDTLTAARALLNLDETVTRE